jgi:CO/xanthine dehydrogenase FAD-binding subunit
MPRSLSEAVALLRQGGADTKLLAGGQSLGPLLNLRLARPSILVDLNRVEGLAYIRKETSTVSIGAMTRQRDLEFSSLIAEEFPILQEATRQLGHPAIRNRGTVGGSLAHADPAAELPCVLSALNAWIVATGPGGERIRPINAFLLAPYTTDLSDDEILTEIQIPLNPAPESWAFLEFSRRHGDFALAAAAVLLYASGAAYDAARVVVSTPSTAPLQLDSTSRDIAALNVPMGAGVTHDALERVQNTAWREIAELAGPETLTAYQQNLGAVLVRRALAQALDRSHD